jgi:hypothetical protein
MITYLKLKDRWNDEFSDEKKRTIEEIYQPMEGD